ncbi:MAG TPA: DUF4189 domain-containing protein [Candidatus Binataceae bacterium]
MNISLFRHASRVLGRASVPSAVSALCAAGLVFVYLVSFMATPARCDDADMWCGAAWSCEQPVPPQAAQAPSVPQIWTAIAISKSTLGNATSWQASSESTAESVALDRCNRKHHDCSIAISRPNLCIALAVSTNWAWAVGQADTYIGADHVAFANCVANGGTKCVVTADPCSDDGPLATGNSSASAQTLGQSTSAQAVDQQLIGVWEVAIPSPQGEFDMRSQINANGTFSTTFPGSPTSPITGSFSASNGVWVYTTATGSDGGSYTFTNPNQVTMAGRLGPPATWHRASN